jgi:hypothetical protein
MANDRRMICRLLPLLKLVGVCRCSASGLDRPFETAYSAIAPR